MNGKHGLSRQQDGQRQPRQVPKGQCAKELQKLGQDCPRCPAGPMRHLNTFRVQCGACGHAEDAKNVKVEGRYKHAGDRAVHGSGGDNRISSRRDRQLGAISQGKWNVRQLSKNDDKGKLLDARDGHFDQKTGVFTPNKR